MSAEHGAPVVSRAAHAPTALWATLARAIGAYPSRIAVVDGARSLSFADIDIASTLRAQALERAIPSRAPLLIDMPRGADAIIEIVAALRSGRGVVPLDRSLPPARVEHVLATSSASHASSLGAGGHPVLTTLARGDAHVTTEDEDLLYVLYTSGSTGVPKGVSMGTDPISRLVDWHLSWESGGSPPRTLQLAPLTFDVSWQEILTSLALGGTLVIAPDEARRDTSLLLRTLRDEGIDRLFLPTALLAPLADRARRAPPLRDLSHIFVAGSQLRITPEVRDWLTGMKSCVLHNHYGPTEAHVVTSHSMRADDLEDVPPIGRVLPHVEARIRTEQAGDVAEGELGELWIGGPCLAHGYRGRADLTAERFTVLDGERWYRTGDLVSRRDGVMRFHGRADRQVKIDGHRVELAELEALISRHPEVRDVHIAAVTGAHGTRLVGYVVAGAEIDAPRRELDPPWRAALVEHVPPAVIPSTWMRLARLPLNTNGKVDVEQLPVPSRERPALSTTYSPPASAAERALTALWEETLEIQGIGRDDNLVDLGATSLTVARLAARIASARDVELPLVTLYAHPTIASLATALEREAEGAVVTTPAPSRVAPLGASEPIAIVGLACRFPGAKSSAELWHNLLAERESITHLPRRAADEPGRVRAGGVLDDIDSIDASFFGLSVAQARELDPQQRLLLECAVEALEDAALGGASPRLSIGVFAGTGPSTYLINNLLRARGIHTLTSSMSELSLLMGNDKEFVAARASYALDLRGPSVNVNAACATSLFALHHAVRALRAGECDVALAGAASVQTPQLHGHRYEESMPFSPDGHCRVFEQGSRGTVFGNGVGVVALKPLSRALADGDDIYATILGTGIANDGADKLGMTAPSVSGQERAIRGALADAGVPASSIRYVEAHGTGTQVGDAIEITALKRAYGELPAGSCGIGSIKTNLGHLGWAAGMAGLFKAVLSLRHGVVPPQIHFELANPDLALGETPFTVVDRPYPLDDSRGPARVAVSAFGIGGFDAHVVLERAPERRAAAAAAKRWHVLPLSGRSERAVGRLAELHGGASAQVPTADLARTLSLGRRHHDVRRAAVVAHGEDPSLALRALDALPRAPLATGRPVVGLFAGHSHERSGLARALYETEPVYRGVIDGFDGQLRAAIGTTVGEILYGPADGEVQITDLVHMHVAVFAMQLGLFRLWESRGPRIDILIGHSLGQYAAACAAGVLSPQDAIHVLIARGRAIGRAASDGTMAIARTDASTVSRVVAELGASIDIAAINGPRNTVIAGRRADLERLTAALQGRVEITMMGALRAGHSRWMEPVTGELVEAFAGVELRAPTRTLLCSVRGGVAGPEIATAAYWGEHLRRTVRFADCVRQARELGGGAFVELGCSPGLLGVASSVIEDHEGPFIPVARPGNDCERTFAQAIATAYEAGLPIDWTSVVGDSGLPAHLPTYPFERARHWVGPGPIDVADDEPQLDRLFHELRWQPLPMASASLLRPRWGVIGNDAALIERLALERPAFAGRRAVSTVLSELDHLLVALGGSEGDDPLEALRAPFELVLETLSRLAARGGQLPRLWLVTRNAQRVRGDERVDPVARASWGLARSLRLEQPELRVTLVDIDTPEESAGGLAACVRFAPDEAELAIRGSAVWTARLSRSEAPSPAPISVRADHAYLVIGGLGGLGLFAAERLAARGARSLVLAGRSEPGAAARERVEALVERGCDVHITRLDVADAAAVDALVASFAAPSAPPLGGIIHSACSIDDVVLADCDWQRAEPVMRAKVLGAWNLHRSLARHALQPSFFVLCSSASAVHGNYGQGAYAAANAYLQGLALERSRAGLAALAIDWGVLDGVGQVASDPALRDALLSRGLGTVSVREIEQVLFEHGATSSGQLSVLPNRWERYIEAHGVADCSVWRALGAEASEDAPAEQAPATTTTTLRDRVMALPEAERERAVSAHLVELVRRVAPPALALGAETRIADLGLDSLSTIQLKNALQTALQVSLPPRLFAQSPMLGDVVAVAVASLATQPPSSRPMSIAAPPPAARDGGPVPLSIEQRRWLRLATELGYGRRLVPAFVHTSLDRAAFTTALRTVVSRHEVLRQRYPTSDSAEVLDVSAVLPSESELFVDASDDGLDACAARVASELARLEGEALDATKRPLWSIRCIALPGDRSFLVLLNLQHLEFDGSGLSVFFDELRVAYAAAQRGEAPALPAVVQYREHAEGQARALESGLAEERAYFSGLFAAVRRPTVLRGAPALARTEAHPSRRFTPARALGRWDRCLSAAERLGVTPFSVVLASYAALLSRVVGEPTVTISIIRSVRADARLAGTIGPFTMPFPVPVHVRGWSARELVAQVDGTLAEITNRPAYPSTDLRHCARAFAGLPEDTYFGDVGMNFLSYRRPESTGQPRIEPIEILDEVRHPLLARHDFGALKRVPGLHLVASPEGEQLRGSYWYHLHRFRESQVAGWASTHREILADLIESCERTERSAGGLASPITLVGAGR